MEALSKSKIKWISSLRLKKNREAESLFIVEGPKMVNELITNWPNNIHLIVSISPVDYSDVPCFKTDEQGMKKISGLKTNPEILAVVKMPNINQTKKGLVLVIDGVQDPGNMGTIIRTADWFGVAEIVCSSDTVDVYNPKVVQASMGSLFRLSIRYDQLTSYLKTTDLPIYGALLNGIDFRTKKLTNPAILVMGNEGNGISKEVQQFIQEPLFIPQFGQAESLNVGVATGILLAAFMN